MYDSKLVSKGILARYRVEVPPWAVPYERTFPDMVAAPATFKKLRLVRCIVAFYNWYYTLIFDMLINASSSRNSS